MADVDGLSDAHVVLLAIQLISATELHTLHAWVDQHRATLTTHLLYRLLLSFYPVDSSKQSNLADFLDTFTAAPSAQQTRFDLKVDPSISGLSSDEATHRCRSLQLQTIPKHSAIRTDNELAHFIVAWAKRSDDLGGTGPSLRDCIDRLSHQDPDLRGWYERYFVPIFRLRTEFYPNDDQVVSLDDLENASRETAVFALLQHAERRHDPQRLARDLDHVVAPWVHGACRDKRRRLDDTDETEEQACWQTVNQWLVSSSLKDFDTAGLTFLEWHGPPETSPRTDATLSHFAQTGLAIVYGCPHTTPEALALCGRILDKVAQTQRIPLPDLTTPEPDVDLDAPNDGAFHEADLVQSSLLRASNSFTRVDAESVRFLVGVLKTAVILSQYGLPMLPHEVAQICIFGSERRHKDELRRLLQHIPRLTRKEIDWRTVRRQILWLRSWTHQPEAAQHRPRLAFLSRLPPDYVDVQVLDVLLHTGQVELVEELYMSAPDRPLPQSDIESRIVAVILETYDNASNGNRDRGGMKRAHETLTWSRPKFPQSTSLLDLQYLIKATHSLSFYQLTLQHGVPFRPVAIRVQRDPLSLVERVLQQDSKAYTKLDDLLQIGANLVRAHLPSRGLMAEDVDPLEVRLVDAEHRITYHAIMAALDAQDFDTAYAYITTRLSTYSGHDPLSGNADDTSWRAAYAAGSYQPRGPTQSLNHHINSLTQRMELLSRALILAPPGESLCEILSTWQRYESEMDRLKAQAVEEERAFEARADASLPGAFGLEDREADATETKRALANRSGPGRGSGPSYLEEAPLGLFDVARGAANALRKSAALPLGSAGLRDLNIRPSRPSETGPPQERDFSSTLDDDVEGERVRKRDMVANMVTNSLVSGMGWVLGAQSSDRADQRA